MPSLGCGDEVQAADLSMQIQILSTYLEMYALHFIFYLFLFFLLVLIEI